MKRERFEPIAGPAPRMSQAARADIEALRASDRLQRIFESDFRSRGGALARRDDAAGSGRTDGAHGAGRLGLFSSRRARVLVGLVPLYAGVAVLAADGVLALRDQPERAALVATFSQADDAAPEVEPDVARTGASTGASIGAGEDTGGDVGGDPGEAGVRRADRDGRQAPAKVPVADRDVAQAEAGVVPEGDPAEPDAAETDGERLALAPATRVVARPAKPESGLAPETRGVPEMPAVEAGRAAPAKASDDLAKTIDASPAAGHVAGPEEPGAATVPEEIIEAVPQATWSPRAAPPVPAPAPRFARLSEVLAQDGARRGAGTAEAAALPRETRPAAKPAMPLSQRQAGAADWEVPRQQSGSAPPRIVVHYRGTSGASAARRVADALQARGFARTELRPVSFGISAANVRYFHARNRPVAREVNELLGSMWRRSDLRDFTHYSPLPSVGTVEVWLPG